MNVIYCDHAASTPLREELIELLQELYRKELYANPSSLHRLGFRAKQKLEKCREEIANNLGASKEAEVIFTSGATEANNLVLLGLSRLSEIYQRNEILVSPIEHSSVFEVAEFLKTSSSEIKIKYLEVDCQGFVKLAKLKEQLNSKTLLVSVIHAQNEIGTIQPIKSIAKLSHQAGAFFHTDAVQSVGKIPFNFEEEQIDFLTLSAHKFNGPKGIGALIKNKQILLKSIFFGGGQEGGLRSGTENLANIWAMSEALKISLANYKEEQQKCRKLQREILGFLSEKKVLGEKIFLNGAETLESRLANNLSFSFKNLTGDQVVSRLNLKKILASTSSACNQQEIRPSRIIENLEGFSDPKNSFRAKNSLRLSFGISNSLGDLEPIKKALYELALFS